MRNGFLGLAVGLVLSGCADQTPPSGPSEQSPAPLFVSTRAELAVARYIVVFRPTALNLDSLTDALIKVHGGKVRYRYRSALLGFAATLPAAALEGIRRNPNVDYVESDGVASVTEVVSGTPSWGLDRIDGRDLPLDGVYSYQNTGAGVRVYIVDTGVNLTHPEYSGRVGSGWDFVDNDGDASDCHGHGTHVSGTVAGTTVGVAKGATIIAVRVLGCTGSGPWSQVITGIDWLIANHVKPAVANMSLGGGYSEAVNTAVSNAVTAGITMAVSAGNQNLNACNYSPASTPSALTVAATTRVDARAPFSNYGACVDLFAPGTDIYSSVMNGGYESWNGTSMSAPHVSGVAALFLAANPAATPAEVNAAILDGATLDGVTDAMTGSPNRLLYNQIAGEGVLPPLPPPPPPSPPDPSSEVRVADLDGTAKAGRGSWAATVRILVQDLSGAPIPNASVNGEWTEGARGSGWCTTGSDGWCSVLKDGIKKGVPTARFGVYSVKVAGKVYAAVKNTDPDADSDGTAIVVRRP